MSSDEKFGTSCEGFIYEFEFLIDPVSKVKSLKIWAENNEDKREWSLVIDDAWCESELKPPLLPLEPEIIKDIFKSQIEEDPVLKNYYETDFPDKVKDESGSLTIIIRSKNFFANLCQDYHICLPQEYLPVTKKLEKQLASSRNENAEFRNELALQKEEIDHLKETVSDLKTKLESYSSSPQYVFYSEAGCACPTSQSCMCSPNQRCRCGNRGSHYRSGVKTRSMTRKESLNHY